MNMKSDKKFFKSIAPILALLLGVSCSNEAKFAREALGECDAQVHKALSDLDGDNVLSPRNIAPGDSVWNCMPVSQELWTEGFWPGILWYEYEATGKDELREWAAHYTEALEFIAKQPAYDHDVGFIIFPSYGNAYRLTGQESYRDVVIEAAERIAALFNPKVGTLLSWPREVPAFGGHNTIMDNLINLETLFWAAQNGGRPELRDIAIMHADTTMKYNFRPDGTSYHVAVYDASTGSHKYSCTHQGYSDDSMWARGQAWGIYGYTMCYRFTREQRYLDFACRIADVYLDKLPEDMVPYWDFMAPDIPRSSKDASAAAVVASALLELENYVPDGRRYHNAAVKMLRSLHDNYNASGTNDAFLLHSTGHHPAGSEIDYSIVYADYYYIEALLRLKAKK